MPLLPNLDLKNDPSELTELVQTYKQEVTEASCELICDWAQKILKRSFDTVVEIARYLIQEHIVNPRSSQAELVSGATLAGCPAKPYKVIKKTSGVSKAELDSEPKKDPSDSAPALKSERKPSETQPSVRPAVGRRLQVEAFMKKLPTILPRSSLPDSLSIRSSPPSLAPKDSAPAANSGGGVKVIAMATLQPQQQGVPLMILPQGCLSYERPDAIAPPTNAMAPPPSTMAPPPSAGVVSAAHTPVVQKVKRRLESLSTPPPVKRKRGRPRKPRPEEAPPPPPSIITTVTGGVIQKATSTLPSPSPVVELVFGHLPEPARPVLLLQNPQWELPSSHMVEVIQKTPRATLSPAHSPQPSPAHSPQHEVELTLTPVEPEPPGGVVKLEEEEPERLRPETETRD
ncbi:unnamed protein product [Knipowitschia caucasica]